MKKLVMLIALIMNVNIANAYVPYIPKAVHTPIASEETNHIRRPLDKFIGKTIDGSEIIDIFFSGEDIDLLLYNESKEKIYKEHIFISRDTDYRYVDDLYKEFVKLYQQIRNEEMKDGK